MWANQEKKPVAIKISKFSITSLPSSTYIFVLLFILFSVTVQNFFTPANLSTILLQSSVLVLVSVGASLVIMTGGIDLSVGAIISLCAIVIGLLLRANTPFWIAAFVGIGCGILYGIGNGLIVHKLHIPAFIATFGSMGIAQSLANYLSDKRTVYWEGTVSTKVVDRLNGNILEIYFGAESTNYFFVPILVLVCLAVVALVYFIFKQTALGQNIYALGFNEEIARLNGINTSLWSVTAYAISGLMAAVAAVLLVVRTNCAQPTVGDGMEFQAIVAATIGGNVSEGGKGSIPGAILGAFTIYSIRNAVNYLGLSSHVSMIITGIALLIGMIINSIVEKYDNRKGALVVV